LLTSNRKLKNVKTCSDFAPFFCPDKLTVESLLEMHWPSETPAWAPARTYPNKVSWGAKQEIFPSAALHCFKHCSGQCLGLGRRSVLDFDPNDSSGEGSPATSM